MRRFRSLVSTLCLPGVAALALSGCAGGEQFPEPPLERRAKAPKKKGAEVAELAAPTDGTIKGRVVLDGAEPKIVMIQAMADHNDKAVCLAPDASESEKIAQQWILAPDKKGVANVVIRLVPPSGKKFKEIPPTENVVVDQPHCAFVPHIVALTPKQKLVVKNSAPVPHNIKMIVDPASGNSNKSIVIQPGSALDPMDLNYQKKPIEIACDFHSWMTGKVFVNDSPYIAVTKADGSFEIPKVPTGVKLRIEGYHEGGTVDGGGEHTFNAGVNELDLKVRPK